MNTLTASTSILKSIPPSVQAMQALGVETEPKEGPAANEAARAGGDYDAIVIGSGIGGLTAAALLAREQGWRVLILEQHFTVGGLTHEFRRGNYQFDVGLHYIGNLHPGSPERAIYDYLSDGQLQWQRMPDDFERFVYPNFEFRVPSDPAVYRQRLVERFPAEAKAIRRYFRDIRSGALGYIMAHLSDALPRWMRGGFRLAMARRTRLAGLTTQAYLERNVRDPALRALLASQWGDYGLPPSESLFGAHALIVQHYLHGAWYPVGGAKSIARTILPGIVAKGGKAVAGRKVTGILLENGRAVGVRVQRTYRPDLPEEVYRAPVIVSDAGVYNTYLKLLPAETPVPFRDALLKTSHGYSAATLYLGLKESPAKLGIQGENVWLFESTDHEAIRKGGPLGGQVYLSFPSMKDPDAKVHTAEVITFLKYEDFTRWADQPWKHRDEAYRQLKAEIGGTLLKKVEARLPGFTALVDFQELSTPVTMEHFQQSPRGTFYGMPARPGRLFAPWTSATSPVPGLYLTGQDVMSLGVSGALMGGIKCAGAVSGRFGFFKLMGAIVGKARRKAMGAQRTGAGPDST